MISNIFKLAQISSQKISEENALLSGGSLPCLCNSIDLYRGRFDKYLTDRCVRYKFLCDKCCLCMQKYCLFFI